MLKDIIYELGLNIYLPDHEIFFLGKFERHIGTWMVVNYLCYVLQYEEHFNRAFLSNQLVNKFPIRGDVTQEQIIAESRRSIEVGYYLLAIQKFREVNPSYSRTPVIDNDIEKHFPNSQAIVHFPLHSRLKSALSMRRQQNGNVPKEVKTATMTVERLLDEDKQIVGEVVKAEDRSNEIFNKGVLPGFKKPEFQELLVALLKWGESSVKSSVNGHFSSGVEQVTTTEMESLLYSGQQIREPLLFILDRVLHKRSLGKQMKDSDKRGQVWTERELIVVSIVLQYERLNWSGESHKVAKIEEFVTFLNERNN